MEERQMVIEDQPRERLPQQLASPRAPHPRRPPAHKSVSLLHSPPRHKPIAGPRRHRHDHGTPASIQANPQYFKDSSGESSNAEKWFEASNNNVRNASASLIDNDPPFLLRNSSSSEPSPEGRSDDPMATSHPHTSSLPYRRPSLIHMPTMASSSDDYRSIIDDLTVQNRKLKRKLKNYERFETPGMQSDRVIEVRTFNMPAKKKRELEELLKKFTMSLDESQVDESSGYGHESISRGAPLETKNTHSSHISTRFVDSAYASMSASGNRSTAASGHSVPCSWKMPRSGGPQSVSHQQHQNIQAYLQDIPVGLLPKSGPIAMTEKSKRKMAVRRLEQIFAGKASATGGHQHPQQQQEVAQSAAHADRKAIEDSGHCALQEGAREARIMPNARGGSDEASEEASPAADDQRLPVNNKNPKQDFANETVDQRPTRPLDLDPFRAQIPYENIRYIRHLGFSPQDAESTTPQADGHGWIYLNLLINMAQLHTMNVTADFVRKSISELSQKLELSHDGRKVRWKGGLDVTRTSSDSSPDDDHGRHGASSYLEPEPGKKSKLATAMSSNDGSSENVKKSHRTSNNRFTYTPLFFHKAESDDEMSEDGMETGYSSPQAALTGDSSGFTSSGMRTHSSRSKRGDDGPIVFYNKANFYTDLSGDPGIKSIPSHAKGNYSRLVSRPVGDARQSWYRPSEPLDSREPLPQPHLRAGNAMDVDNKSPSDVEMEIYQETKPFAGPSSSEESPIPIELEASGIGGVMPDDNFAIRIKARRQLHDQSASISTLRDQRSKMYPPGIRDILTQGCGSDSTLALSKGKGKAVIKEHVVSERRKELPPSKLPPPSFFPFCSPDDSDDSSSDSDIEGDLTDSAAAFGSRPLPSVAPQVFNWPTYASSEESSSEESDHGADEDESNRSVDLLATARKADLMAVHVQERECDSHIAERLAEEIPAGSSAATAGGGSGFNSPNSPEVRSGRKAAGTASKKPPLKRTRTDDSVPVQGRIRKSPKLEA